MSLTFFYSYTQDPKMHWKQELQLFQEFVMGSGGGGGGSQSEGMSHY